ncbi:VOC family protein [Amycolatopsis tucumanensis]|uniref:Glyoxalase/fosfomycin resistance/dioxygenase domain-containing protein n=1 Tax=Amycolatopsis tucumanensis TaxID=401106 RepID=A0ABP7IQA3_9PSEU|nr:VOC family protein [Amycolatopsis tucumanensis]
MLTNIMYATVYMTDQDRALKFYTEKLGLDRGVDYPRPDGRFLTVGVPGSRSRSSCGRTPRPPDNRSTRVARRVAAGARLSAAAHGRAVLVNGRPGFVAWSEDDAPLSIIAFTVADGRIVDIAVVTDPVKLAAANLPDPA